jgi:hypothetical protein
MKERMNECIWHLNDEVMIGIMYVCNMGKTSYFLHKEKNPAVDT